jgi:tRNA-dihydrouridine synthase
MLRETGVDLVWIARGAIGNPWIFRHAAMLLESEGTDARRHEGTKGTSPASASCLLPPSIHEQRDALAEHFAIAMQIHGEQLAGRRMRKMGIKYSRFHPQAPRVKADFINVRSLRDWMTVLETWYAHDAPGVWPAANAADEVNESADLQSCDATA